MRREKKSKGEIKKGDVIVGGLVPVNQNAPKAVYPAVSTFHHPVSGFEVGLSFDGLGLFATASNVGGASRNEQQVAGTD